MTAACFRLHQNVNKQSGDGGGGGRGGKKKKKEGKTQLPVQETVAHDLHLTKYPPTFPPPAW